MVGGGVALTDKILYQNGTVTEMTVDNHTPDKDGLDFEDVSLETRDGANLACWLIKAEEAATASTLLYFHGNAGDMASRLEHVKNLQGALKCNVFMVSYRGYGKSSGKPSEEGFNEDAHAAFKYLAESPNIASSKIMVYGHSIGGAVAIHLCHRMQSIGSEAQPVGLIVENTFTSIAEMAGPLMRRVGGYLPSQWNNNEVIQEITCPILLLSGRADTIVPPEMMDMLKCVATSSKECTLVEFPEQGHNDVSQGEGYLEKIQAFVSSVV